MPGYYGVKIILRWIWLKIEICNLQTPYIDGMYLVSVGPLGPYPKSAKKTPWAERGWFLLQHSPNFNSYSYITQLLLLPIGGVNIFHNFAPDPTADSYPLDNCVL